MDSFLDIYHASLIKHGEELCGDKVRVLSTPERAIVVLSDGLGSGVKANILATMTTSIIVTMLAANVAIAEVIRTVIDSLPIDRVRKSAYATFTVAEIDRASNRFKVTNYDNPPPFFLRRGKVVELKPRAEEILGRRIAVSEGQLERGDFLGMISDGLMYAGVGTRYNLGWGWANVARYLEGLFITRPPTARGLVRKVVAKTNELYQDSAGDDATFAGIYVRLKHRLIVFTGPPLDRETDARIVERFLGFKGRKVVSGGTTANIVARYLGVAAEPDLSTMREEVPPMGRLPGIDLVTEGILTLSKALEYLKDSGGESYRLPVDETGAVFLARELLNADSITFLVGQSVNEFYQNPLLPPSVQIRRNLVESLARTLTELHKEVTIEYC